jgi:hypothetical protein
MKFYPSDFESDPALRVCGLAAQGLWIRMLCLMHAGTPAGYLTVNRRPVTPEMLAAIIGVAAPEVERLLAELQSNGVYSETENGVIFSRRMVVDAKAYAAAVKNGKTGGNPKITKRNPETNENKGVNPPVNSDDNRRDNQGDNQGDKLEREREIEIDSLPPGAAARMPSVSNRGSRLQESWVPEAAEQDYATKLGLDWRRVSEDFRGYWCSKAGKDALKTNWALTWQGWCRRAAEKTGHRPAAFGSTDGRNQMGSFL